VTLTKPKSRISRIRSEKEKTFPLQQDNTTPHNSLKTVEHIVNLGWTVVPHPPYSLDLAPSDFHLFELMKDGLHGQHSPSNDAIVRAVKQWATSAGADFYERSMQTLVHCWRKCIANGGDYVEK
jgi:histone-lysine N-methyltransferase SETMAR